MKKITLLVPDKMVFVKGTADKSEKNLVETTAESILHALVTDDYHMNYYFEDRSKLRILSVEEEIGD